MYSMLLEVICCGTITFLVIIRETDDERNISEIIFSVILIIVLKSSLWWVLDLPDVLVFNIFSSNSFITFSLT